MYLGIDVSKDSLDCFKLVETSADKQFKNDKQGVNKLLDWLGHDDCHVVMEATGVYWQRCAFALHEKGIRLSVVNPAQVKYFAQSTLRRGKTDNMDACLLANYAATMQPELWQIPQSKLLGEEGCGLFQVVHALETLTVPPPEPPQA